MTRSAGSCRRVSVQLSTRGPIPTPRCSGVREEPEADEQAADARSSASQGAQQHQDDADRL